MSELNSRITIADTAARALGVDILEALATLNSHLADIKDLLGFSAGATLQDIQVSIEGLRSDVAAAQALELEQLTLIGENTGIALDNGAVNTLYIAGAITGASCCDIGTIEDEPDTAIPPEGCQRAQFGVYDVGFYIVKAKAYRSSGGLLNSSYIAALLALTWPSGSVLHSGPPDYCMALASALNSATLEELTNLNDMLFASFGSNVIRTIASSDTTTHAHDALETVYATEGLTPRQASIMRAGLTLQYLYDTMTDAIAYTGYDDSFCDDEEIIVPECTGTASIFSRTLDGATPLPFGSWSGSRSVFYSCPTLDLSFDIDVLNHDDSDALVATVHQGETFTSESDVNYYFKPHDGTSTGEHEFTTCATLLG